MSNMSYCRFENTYKDLRDCEVHILDFDLDENEHAYRKLLLETCRRIIDAWDTSEDNEYMEANDHILTQ